MTADAIREGIMGAYGTQLGGDRYPFAVCFLEVPGDAVDVNVHPRKREVRFDDDDAVRRQVDAAIESALLEHGMLRSRAPRDGRHRRRRASHRREPTGIIRTRPSDASGGRARRTYRRQRSPPRASRTGGRVRASPQTRQANASRASNADTDDASKPAGDPPSPSSTETESGRTRATRAAAPTRHRLWETNR